MSRYSASVRVEDDTLTTSRPLTAPEEVRDLVDHLVYVVSESGGKLTTVELDVETSSDSGTPVADSISVPSSTPLAGAGATTGAGSSDDEDEA